MTRPHNPAAGTGREPSRRDRWTLRTMNREEGRHLHATRTRRTTLVLGHIAVTSLMAGSAIAMCALGEPWWALALLLSLVMWVPLTGMLNSATRGLLELRPHMLDERQQAERGVVMARAYQLTRWGLLVALVGCVAAHALGSSLRELSGPMAALGFLLLVTHFLSPLWIAVLRVEDEPLGGDEV
ncbi:hypothetical protein [Streptomyces sp. NPDC005438]|uniref:hypothetical protein n=1 Tax=Streptomyces sp. NPDC005438 TaxID=3156880 RepID=UPI0033B763C9